jgi:putative membrane protein
MATSETAVHGRRPILPSDLGEVRTIMAADRTLMAWMRTSLSMLSFGFTIYKFLDTMAQHGQLQRSHSPQMVGLFLAALGTVTIIFGTISYWVTLKDLQRAEVFRLGRPILLLALIMCVTGTALFVSIATRIV